MTRSRDAFLQRIRQAVASGQRAGSTAALEPRGEIGYQGAGANAVARFRDELTAAGGQTHVVANQEAAVVQVLELVQRQAARRALLGRGPLIDVLGLGERLRAAGIEVDDALSI